MVTWNEPFSISPNLPWSYYLGMVLLVYLQASNSKNIQVAAITKWTTVINIFSSNFKGMELVIILKNFNKATVNFQTRETSKAI